ncbi:MULTISPECIES: hypothetical protein [Rhizobium]|uniref:hypothetical protein n=1 Tax=Rhizobium TaxID=379 RepID=UPI001A923EA7|nr:MULTISPECIES: hypothetical protein [Rhizobium]MBX4872702.1 hypothetical protein [Rhizobium bangladeshense]MBX5063317.1 hypothetical protein [Rhizobium lentis]MBX5075422.1 hypothetical protein [Rhizobium lentis]QSW93073.1 hypothetical protein J0663_18695 [Rhizobium lentis]
MTKVLLHRSYKSREPGTILDVAQAEADGLVNIGIGEILKEEQPAPKKAGKGSDAE